MDNAVPKESESSKRGGESVARQEYAPGILHDRPLATSFIDGMEEKPVNVSKDLDTSEVEKITTKLEPRPEIVHDHPATPILSSLGEEKDEEDKAYKKTLHLEHTTVQQTSPHQLTSRPSRSEDPVQNAEIVEAYVIQKKYLCLPESVLTTNSGTIKRSCWIFLAALLICGIIIAIVVSLTSKSSSNNTSVPSYSLPITPTKSPSIVPSQYPSTQPTVTTCDNVCLEGIEQVDCPNNPSLLRSCHVVVTSNLCINDSGCPTDDPSFTCGTNFHIYRRKKCPIDEPWTRTTNGFEYFIETLTIDWTSHKTRATQFNASLASIHSQAEMDYIVNMLSKMVLNEAFLGGFRKGISNDPWNNGSAAY